MYVVRTFRSAQHGRPEGLHYIVVKDAIKVALHMLKTV